MVDEYALWYDRHLDPAWQEALLSPYEADGERVPWAYVAPKKVDDLVGMGRSFAKTMFLSAGNVTHTPAYGNLIALGVLTAAQSGEAPPEQIAAAAAYRDGIARTGRFLTYCGGAPIIGQRMRPDPAERVALKLVRETDAGIVISRPARHAYEPGLSPRTSMSARSRGWRSAAARRALSCRSTPPASRCCAASAATRDANPFVSPLSSRFDELDGQMWLDEVLIPWERVFFVDPSPEAIPRWLRWHHLYGWLAKAEFTLGLALALTHAMGLSEHEQTIDYLIDLVITVQTVRSSLDRGRARPRVHPGGVSAFPTTPISRPAASR